jgi:hypothetical protein
VLGHALANRLLTGDWSAAGAVVKLELHHPKLGIRGVWSAWARHFGYQFVRITSFHVGDGFGGTPFWLLAALPLAFRRTRGVGAVLWAQAVLWMAVVALNGQVRWQNERYTMPAVAWLLLSMALGVGAVCTHAFSSLRAGLRWPARATVIAAVAGLLGFLGVQQVDLFRDQVWFFGRAARNIRDQHLKVARKIRAELPGVRRVLVGDAGAIPYESDLQALDAIGLGGWPGLPFARAGRWGVAATIELLERIPPDKRPDVLAIYPDWWGDLPLWFGKPITGIAAQGNVICGGITKVLYEPRWDALDGSEEPAMSLAPGEEVVDRVDFADLVSEAEHGYRITGARGNVEMKVLPHPRALERPLWDGGRVVPRAATVSLVLRGFRPGTATRLVIRTAPARPAILRVSVDGAEPIAVTLLPGDAWQEVSVSLPRAARAGPLPMTLSVERNTAILYHLWALERR